MSLPETCPFCGAGPGPYVNSYLCGTYLRAGVDARKHQTKRCVTGQMFAWVKRARKAEARCKQLEEALENVINSGKPNQSEHPSMWKAWLKARLVMQSKEAKP